MKLHKLLKTLANIYLGLFFLIWSIAMINIFLTKGVGAILEVLSPFNFANLIVTLISVSPVLILYTLAEKAKTRAIQKSSAPTQ